MHLMHSVFFLLASLSVGRMQTPRLFHCPSSRMFRERFLVQKFIAAGREGGVYQCRDTLFPNRKTVLKVTSRFLQEKSCHDTPYEVVALGRLGGTKLFPELFSYWAGHGKYGCESWIAMTKAPGKTLYELTHPSKKSRRRISPNKARHIFQKLVQAVQLYLQAQIHHRDIKEKNIVVAPVTNDPIIIDFGLSVPVTKRGFSHARGISKKILRDSFPPEFYVLPTFNAERAEVWALGVLLYNILYAASPFRTHEDKVAGRVDTLVCARCPKDALPLIQKMLAKNWRARPGLDKVLRDPWLQVQ